MTHASRLLAILCLACAAHAQTHTVNTYAKLPLSFTPNQGQFDPAVTFVSRGSGYSVALTRDEADLTLQSSRPATVRMQLLGTAALPAISGVDPLPGTANYLIGNDPKKWHTNLPTYARVKYAQVYPGVDLVYYGNQHQLEFDLIVQPGTDPASISLGFQGEVANHPLRLKIDPTGNLVVDGPDGGVLLPRPTVYQQAGNKRESVDGTYLLSASQHLTFRLGAYDHTRPVIIDPILTYSTFLGGSVADQATALTVDAEGNAYVTGVTNSPNFPTTPGVLGTPTLNNPSFVSKLSPDGSALLYSTCVGGLGGATTSTSIAVDATGDAYVAGYTYAKDYPTTPGAFQHTFSSLTTSFLSKLNSTGTGFVYSTLIGGSLDSNAFGLAVDSTGHAYLGGDNYAGDFPTTPGAYKTAPNPAQPYFVDVFLAKFDPTGSSLVYSTLLGDGPSEVSGLALDNSGDVFLTGFTNDPNFPTSPGAFSSAGSTFVTKFNQTGSALLYSTRLRGSAVPGGIAIDSAGDAYITGSTGSNDLPTTPGAFKTTDCAYCSDAFVTKLNPTGTGFVYSTYLAGDTLETNHSASGYGTGRSIAVDSVGNAYIAGSTLVANFPTTPDAFQNTYGGGYSDGFFTRLNASGSAILYSTFLGGKGTDVATGVAVDPAGNAYVAGSISGSSSEVTSTFPTTPNSYQPTYGGGDYDAFVTRFSALTPFCKIKARDLLIDLDTARVDEDNYTLDATFVPGADPLTNPISLEIGNSFVTIPAGSLVQQGTSYSFHGEINGKPVAVLLQELREHTKGSTNDCTGPKYSLYALVRSINLGPLTNPVTVTVTIGDKSGTTQLQATIRNMIYE